MDLTLGQIWLTIGKGLITATTRRAKEGFFNERT